MEWDKDTGEDMADAQERQAERRSLSGRPPRRNGKAGQGSEVQDIEASHGGYDEYGEPDEYGDYGEYGEYEESDELTEPKPVRKKRRKRHFVLNIIIIALVIAGLLFFATSDVFMIRSITAESNGGRFTDAKIVELSGIKIGDNLWKARMGEAEKRLLGDPYIAEAQVWRKLPGTVSIEIKERTENYLIASGGKYVVLDWSGMVLNAVAEAPELPVIEGIELNGIVTGAAVKAKRALLLNDAVKLLRDAEKAGISFGRIAVSDVNVTAYISDTLSIKGKLADISSGLNKVKLVLKDLKKQKIKRGTIIAGSTGNFTFSPEAQ